MTPNFRIKNPVLNTRKTQIGRQAASEIPGNGFGENFSIPQKRKREPEGSLFQKKHA